MKPSLLEYFHSVTKYMMIKKNCLIISFKKYLHINYLSIELLY